MIQNEDKIKEQLISELAVLRQQVAELEILVREHKQVEDMLIESEGKYRTLVNNVRLGIFRSTIGPPGKYLEVNPALEEITGYSREELLHIRPSQLYVHPEERQAALEKVASAPGAVTGERKFRKKDGTEIIVSSTIIAIKGSTGEPLYFDGITEDITERKKTEEELWESEERYRALFEQMLDGFAYCKILVDKNNKPVDFVYLDINDAFERLTGLRREDVVGRKVTEAIPGTKESHPELFSIYGKVALTGEPTKFDIYFKPLGIWLTISVYSPQKDYFVAIFENITERKRAEEEIRKSEEKYRNLVDNSNDIVITADESGNWTFLSPSVTRVLGYEPAEMVGKPAFDFMFPEDVVTTREAHEGVVREGRDVWQFENRYIHKDGRIITLAWNVVAFRNEQGNIIGTYGVGRDITERKQAEDELRESEERYRALVNLGGSVGEAIIMLQDKDDVDAVQTFVSDEWPRITGYSRKELLGMSFFDLLHPRHREASLKRHGRKMSGEIIPGLFEMSIIRKDGTEVPIEITSAYTTYKGERANVAFIRDITERKQAEEREKELQQELYLSTRLASIGELAAGIAHEINNPLTGVLGFSQRLLRKSTDENTKEGLEIIYTEAQRAAKVVENLLTFARHREPKKEYSDVNDILQEALELRTYELQTSNIEVVTDLAPSLPEVMVDFHQMQEVFLNIILNAEQVMTEANSGGKLSIKTEERKNYIRISFTDDGPGIPTEQLDRVFDPFFTTREERGGTGLGLSACHGIVTEHGGKIYARSKPGKGATFFVELPLTLIDTS